jgi:hypothetical protein
VNDLRAVIDDQVAELIDHVPELIDHVPELIDHLGAWKNRLPRRAISSPSGPILRAADTRSENSPA